MLKNFKTPPTEYYPVNMWFWDDKITKEEISFQLDKFLEMGIYQIFIHPMWGTTVDYLSGEFFSLIAYMVSEAKIRGQKYWIYDEYNWPSGPAGGKLFAAHPWARGKFMRIKEISILPGYKIDLMLPGKIYAVRRTVDYAAGIYDDATAQCEIYKIDGSGGGNEPTADWHRLIIHNHSVNDYVYKIFYIENERSVLVTDVWGERSNYTEGYINALDPEAVRAFIELTHERYKRYIGDEFGKTVMGVFTDEPCIAPITEFEANGLPWYEGLEKDFRLWAGYDINEKLEFLYMPGDTDAIKNLKIDFWRFLGQRFQKVFIAEMAKWCADNNLILTGHMCGEESLWTNLMQSVDIFGDLSEFHLPGMDTIFSKQRIDMTDYNMAGKILASVGRFYNKSRLLSETYTGSGWDLRFSDMRRIANRLILLGANMIQYMGSYYTLDNMRKLLPICYPPSHSYNNPLMCGYKPFGEYVARLQYLSEITKPAGKALVMMPTLASFALNRPTSVFMGQNDGCYCLRHMDCALEIAVNALLAANIEYDFASDTLAGNITCGGGALKLYGAEYDWLILPAMHCTDEAMSSAIREYISGGGKVLFINGRPESLGGFFAEDDNEFACERFIDGAGEFELVKLEGFGGAYHLPLDLSKDRADLDKKAQNVFRDLICDHISYCAEHDGGVLISERSGELFDISFIVNDTPEYKELAGTMPHERCIFLNPETGGARFVKIEDLKFGIVLEPNECVVMVLFKNAADMEKFILPEDFGASAGKPRGDIVSFDGNWNFAALEPNVLIPEKSIIKQDGSVFFTNGFDIPKETGLGKSDAFSVCGVFEVADPVPLKLMYESGLVMDIMVNGYAGIESYDKKVWGIDNKEADISEYIKTGKNQIMLICRMPDWIAPFKLPFFCVKGEFRLNAADEISAPWTNIIPASWTGQGFRYYTGRGKYCNSFTLSSGCKKILLDIPTLDPAEVNINGTALPKRHWAPFVFDLTGFVKPGPNELAITFDTCYSNLLDKPVESGMTGEPVIYSEF